jgi:hypothetical protein
MKHDALFQPLALCSITLRNRIVMSAMTREPSPGGVPGPDVAAVPAAGGGRGWWQSAAAGSAVLGLLGQPRCHGLSISGGCITLKDHLMCIDPLYTVGRAEETIKVGADDPMNAFQEIRKTPRRERIAESATTQSLNP